MTGQKLIVREETMVTQRKCPDCISCQGCSRNRCRQCQAGRNAKAGNLGPFLTHGEYLAWKKKVRPEVESSPCGSCAEREWAAAK